MDLDKLHGIVEDIGGVIGYTATANLIDWFGGSTLYIPIEAKEDHPICRVIGFPAFTRLVKEWPGEKLCLPLGYSRELNRRDRMIAVLLELGIGSKSVAAIAGMSERHVQHARHRLEVMGVLPMILKKAGLQNRVANAGVQNRVVNAGVESRQVAVLGVGEVFLKPIKRKGRKRK